MALSFHLQPEGSDPIQVSAEGRMLTINDESESVSFELSAHGELIVAAAPGGACFSSRGKLDPSDVLMAIANWIESLSTGA